MRSFRAMGTTGKSTGQITLRAGRSGDEATLADVHVRSWQWAYRDLLPAEALAGLDRVSRATMWLHVLAGDFDGAQVWIAERDGAVVGFVADGPSREEGAPDDQGEIYAIYVVEGAVGQGVGHALLTQAVDDLRDRGAVSAVLWVLAANQRARAFFERASWRADGASKSEPWEGVTLDEVRYAIEFGHITAHPT